MKHTGQFKVCKLDPLTGNHDKPVHCKTQDHYKVSLLIGETTIKFTGKTIQLKKQALVFSSPDRSYSWEHNDNVRDGYYCIFDETLFHHYESVAKYSVFQPGGNHVFELTDQQVNLLIKVYERMVSDNQSDDHLKNDKFRLGVSELIHFALRMLPTTIAAGEPISASQQIFALFKELLEVQFPIDFTYNCIRLRSPTDFAGKLNIHVRHLNKVVKKVADKTTSQLIREHTLQEAKNLLIQTSWTVEEIAFVLGFAEANHFSVFFKKHVQLNPLKFRVGELNQSL